MSSLEQPCCFILLPSVSFLEGIRAAGRPASSVGPYRRGREELASHRYHCPPPPTTTPLRHTHTHLSQPRLTLNPPKILLRFHLGFTHPSEFLSSYSFYSCLFLSLSCCLKDDFNFFKRFFTHTYTHTHPSSSLREQGVKARLVWSTRPRRERPNRICCVSVSFSLSRPALLWKMILWARCLLDGVSLPHAPHFLFT